MSKNRSVYCCFIAIVLGALSIPPLELAAQDPQGQLSNADYILYRRETAAGDAFSFQGLERVFSTGVKALGLGGAFTAFSGDAGTLFYNPAGMAGMEKIQVSVSVNRHTDFRMEYDQFEPFVNKNLDMIEHLWAGLYDLTPEDSIWMKPFNTIVWDTTRFTVSPTQVDYWDKDFATWYNSNSKIVLNHLIAAVPFMLLNRRVVVAGAFSQVPFLDDDQNNFYTPTAAVLDYRPLEYNQEATGQDFPWYRFSRFRSGVSRNVSVGVAVSPFQFLDIGLRYDYRSARSEDEMKLSEVALINDFHLLEDYMYLEKEKDERDIRGSSEFMSSSFEAGVLFRIPALNVGVRIRPGYTLKRTWEYAVTRTTQDTLGNDMVDESTSTGENAISFPWCYSFGILLKATHRLNISLDVDWNPYSGNSYDLNGMFYAHESDHSFRIWHDQTILRFGLEFTPAQWLSVTCGYAMVPELVRPLNYNYEVSLPKADVFSAGFSVYALHGRFDAAYQYYYNRTVDIYFTRNSYNRIDRGNCMFGYTFIL